MTDARLRIPGAKYICAAVIILVTSAARLTAADLRLVEAAKAQDVQAMVSLLKEHVDANTASPDGTTALHWSAYWDLREMIDALIRGGARAEATNDLGVTPLYLACVNGSAGAVERLLSAGANANTALPLSETALMAAARVGSVESVKLLVAHGANVNYQAVRAQTALMAAAEFNHPSVIQALVELGADVTARSEVRVRRVALTHVDDHRRENTVTSSIGGYTPLLFTTRTGNVESARLLLAAGADVNEIAADGSDALALAAHNGHTSLASLLLENGANPNTRGAGYTALHAAVLRGDGDLVKKLLEYGADPNVPLQNGTRARYFSSDYSFEASAAGATPYWLAARFAEAEIMKTLAEHGADSRLSSKDGTSPLLAILGGGTSGIGGGSNDRRNRYLTPSELAAVSPEEEQLRTLECVKLVMANGADVNAPSLRGDTPLHLAASQLGASIVQYLIGNGANVNASREDGETPLHNAAYLAKDDVIRALVQHGASLTAKNRKGETPLAKTAVRVRPVAVGVFVTDERLDETARVLRALGATE
jgi:ankyrin